MNFFDFLKKFPTEEAVIEHFIRVRYKSDKPYCPFCKTFEKVLPEKSRPKFFHCNKCNTSFSVFKDTIFEKSSTDLRKWMYAIHLFLNGKKGISGYQLQREIGVTYKTAWRMLKQIRLAMGNVENPEFAETVIEIDETYVGGKPRKGNKSNKDDDGDAPKLKRGRGTKKTPVIGIVDRTSKMVHAKVALPNRQGKSLSGKQLLDVLQQVSKGKNIPLIFSIVEAIYLILVSQQSFDAQFNKPFLIKVSHNLFKTSGLFKSICIVFSPKYCFRSI